MKDMFEIWQINHDIEGARDYMFEPWRRLKNHGKEFKKYLYKKIWSGLLGEKSLDDLYEEFNINHPKGYKGHSLSVSDIIVIKKESEQEKVYYVDSFGFEDITDTFRNASVFISGVEYISTEYTNYGHTASHMFKAVVDHEIPFTFTYEVTRHDGDEESFHIYSEQIDLWNLMSGLELTKVSQVLDDECKIGLYNVKIAKAKTLDMLKEVEFEFMEDEAFPARLNQRFWEPYRARENVLHKTII